MSDNNNLVDIRLVGWEINVTFQHIGDKVWVEIYFHIANNKLTSRPRCLFVQRRPKMEKDRVGSFKLLH